MSTHTDQLDEVIVPAVLSVIGSCAIILTYLCFSDLRRLRYVEFVFYVSINCLIAAIGACMGNVAHNKSACYFQDVTTSANNVSAVFWTVVITYQLYVATVRMGQTLKDIRGFHVFCWLVPWILVFLPLSTNTFGIPDKGGTWCFIDNRKGSPKWGIVTWELVSVYIPIAISIVAMTGLLVSVAIQMQSNTLSELMRVALKKLYLYPVVFVVCWTPSLIANLYIAGTSSDSDISPVLRGFANVCPVLQGFLVALVFFTHNKIVRDHWLHALKIYDLFARLSSSSALLPRGASHGNNNDSSSNNLPSAYYDDSNHKIRVMMAAEKESDYIDDDTRAQFAFRVSFSSNSTSSGRHKSSPNTNNNYLSGDDEVFRSSEMTTSTLNPVNSRDSMNGGNLFVLSSSVNSEPVYVGGRGTIGNGHNSSGKSSNSNNSNNNTNRNTASGLSPDPTARGTLSAQPKQSFLHNNFLFGSSYGSNRPSLSPHARPDNLAGSNTSHGSNSGRFTNGTFKSGGHTNNGSIYSSNSDPFITASLSSSPPGDDPDSLIRGARSIQMSVTSSTSSTSSSNVVNRLRKEQQLAACMENDGVGGSATGGGNGNRNSEQVVDLSGGDFDEEEVKYGELSGSGDFGVRVNADVV
jgi:hypothetical protein